MYFKRRIFHIFVELKKKKSIELSVKVFTQDKEMNIIKLIKSSL